MHLQVRWCDSISWIVFREINFKGSCQTQFYDFFCEINCKTHFHEFFHESFPIYMDCLVSDWVVHYLVPIRYHVKLIEIQLFDYSEIEYYNGHKIDHNFGVYFVLNEYKNTS